MDENKSDMLPIRESFPDEQLYTIYFKRPWFADFANYVSNKIVPAELSTHQCKEFFSDVKHYYWDDSYLWKDCLDQIIHRCMPESEM